MREKPHAVLKPVPAATQAVEPDGSDALERADLAQDPDAHVVAIFQCPDMKNRYRIYRMHWKMNSSSTRMESSSNNSGSAKLLRQVETYLKCSSRTNKNMCKIQ